MFQRLDFNSILNSDLCPPTSDFRNIQTSEPTLRLQVDFYQRLLLLTAAFSTAIGRDVPFDIDRALSALRRSVGPKTICCGLRALTQDDDVLFIPACPANELRLFYFKGRIAEVFFHNNAYHNEHRQGEQRA